MRRWQGLTAVALAAVLLQGVSAAAGAARPISVLATAHTDANTYLTVRVGNASPRTLGVALSDFTLSAEGDMFAAHDWDVGAARLSIAPRRSRVIRLTFPTPRVPTGQAALVLRGSGPAPLGPSPVVARATAAARNILTFSLSGGAGEPWGTAFDRSGDVWFAEPGCDFAPTCPRDASPGQVGELKPRSHAVVLYTLPPIPGNQPIFLAFDRSGNLWFTTPENSKIGEFRPSTGRFIGQWSVTPGSGPWDLTFSRGKIWYSEHLASAVGVFDPRTHRHRDFHTPSANSNPYGIAAAGRRIWFTENNSSVDRVAVLDTRRRKNAISEYQIVRPLSGTPHMIAIGAHGHPWWSEGWSNTIATLDPASAKARRCGRRSGVCMGVRRFRLPQASGCSESAHASGIAVQRSSRLVWLDNSLTAQVGSFDPRSRRFRLSPLTCNAHPHDGLRVGPASRVWFDEEFENALGELIP